MTHKKIPIIIVFSNRCELFTHKAAIIIAAPKKNQINSIQKFKSIQFKKINSIIKYSK